MQDNITLLVIGCLALYGMWWGFGKMTGLWGGEDNGGGRTMGMQGKIALGIAGLVGLMWLSAPGTDQVMYGTFEAARVNLIRGVQPLITLVTELAAFAGILYVVYLVVRRNRRP